MSNELIKSEDKLCELAQEIVNIKAQTSAFLNMVGETVKRSCFEIGRKLTEAKTLVPYGEWGNWLRDNVDYSESTAQNLMRIHKEMGETQIDMISGKAPVEVFADYQYSQLVALFSLPPAERVQFVESNDIADKSVREIDQLIKERDEYKKRAEQAERESKEKEKAAERHEVAIGFVRKEKEKQKAEADRLQAELKKLKDKPTQEVIIQKAEVSEEQIAQIKAQAEKEAVAKYTEMAESLSADIEEREKALEDAKAEAVRSSNEKIAKLEKMLTLAANVKIQQNNFHFTEARKQLIEVVSSIMDIAKEQPDIAQKLKSAILDQLNEITKPIS